MTTHETSNERTTLITVLLVVLIVVMVFGAGVACFMASSALAPSPAYKEVVRLRETIDELEHVRSDADLVFDVLEESGGAVIAVDETGRITLWSTGAEKLFGFTRGESIGYGVAFLIPRGSREEHREQFEKAMVGGDPFQLTVECEATHADGSSIPVRINVYGLPGRMAVAVFSRRSP